MTDSPAAHPPADAAPAIQTSGLTKRFGAQTAVDAVDLTVPRGAVYGFLGPNGSGKTTTIRMLLGLLRATGGEASVLGSPMPRSLDTVLPRVGALVEGPAFSPFLTGAQNLHRFDAAARHSDARTRKARVAAALERVGLEHAARKKAHAYSLGMKQRLGLANALLMPRDLLVLDEPTNGLDPQGTREVRSLIRSFAADGTTVFVSSHLLAEIEQLCTHVGVMNGGRLVAQGTLDEFRRAGEPARVRIRTPDLETARDVLAGMGVGVTAQAASADRELITGVLPAALPPEELVAALVTAGARVRGFEVVGESLEQRFVELTGEGFDVVA
ncbi:ABC transporter ATP-binding protein [Microbacterium thalassium]|uniref:ABC-2 type transport system ATP-binding protein n=1 Tax=Microbacterium thalassium TaxID=362649 RepID=A0A7X0FLJ5_9MICO|nr:ABC transporter ATP-binding protein [Microbacterium thalassium]MBB6389724.1 ABC-2 type transport system ATP-binding protein [Microbacterium thalassium]GLK24775.1 ABC transporter ATP-binding protein [Microbacterium thalassium]